MHMKRVSLEEVLMVGTPEDIAQTALGDIGLFQAMICFHLSLIRIPSAWTQIGYIFLAAPLTYHCLDSKEPCRTSTGNACEKWVYNHTIFDETIVSQWNLVCSDSELAHEGQLLAMLGFLTGSIFVSAISDSIGRKKPLIVAVIVQVIAGVLTAFATSYPLFVFMRFLQSFATGGAVAVGFVLMMELIGGKWKAIMTALSFVPFNLAQFAMILFAYLASNWQTFQMAISIPCIYFISYIWTVPESPRWLIASGRPEEAYQILQAAAKRNKNPHFNLISLATLTQDATGEKAITSDVRCWTKLVQMLNTGPMAFRTIVLCGVWFTTGATFYGFQDYISHLNGNIYMNLCISASLILPGTLSSICLSEYFGRRFTINIGLLLITLSCIGLVMFQNASLLGLSIQIIIVAVGEFGTGILYPTVFLYTGEFYPTLIRNLGVGICCAACRLGFIFAPYISDLGNKAMFLPPFTYGVISLIVFVLCTFLPETKTIDCLESIMAAAEEEREASERRRQSAFEAANVGKAILDDKTNVKDYMSTK